MRCVLLVIVNALLVSSASQGLAQHVDSSWSVGKLTLKDGELSLSQSDDFAERLIRASSETGSLSILTGSNKTDGSYIRMLAARHNDDCAGCIQLVSSGTIGAAFHFMNYNNVSGQSVSHMRIDKDGRVVIGNVSVADNYSLFVQQGILTEKVKVAMPGTGDWPDFVFQTDYPLKSLEEVEQFIEEHGHLPDIPSARQIARDGFDLGAMDALLLQKIEELTLYVIQQQKEIDHLKTQLATK